MIGRLVQAADFKRLLSVAPAGKSAHFALHHLAALPAAPQRRQIKAVAAELSTAHEPMCPQPVDEGQGKPHQGSPDQGKPDEVKPAAVGLSWVGCVVPKRHARRAVTRNLIKRQIRAAAERTQARLPGGLWLVRLRQPFAAQAFESAASMALRAAVRAELDRLFQKVAPDAPVPERPPR